MTKDKSVLDELEPRRAITVVFGDSPIANIIIYLHGKQRMVTYKELRENVDLPNEYNWDDMAYAIERLNRFGALDWNGHGRLRLNYSRVGQHLHQLAEMLPRYVREIKGLQPLTLRVDDGMRFILQSDERTMYFNGEIAEEETTHGWLQ